ncbi:MAG TPA: HD domain-containing phosphohydrolase [Candidatus Cybelea sp.]|nr:HD domain-containing phosphohydrolase [Candidatus Cybelea sp.]
MNSTVLRATFALRKQPRKYPLRRHLTGFFVALFVIAVIAIAVFSLWLLKWLIGLPQNEMAAGYYQISWMLMSVSAALLLLSVFATWALARQLSNPLNTLTEEAQAIRDFDFSNTVAVNTGIHEVDELSIIMNEMKTTIRRFLEIGAAMTAERDLSSLLDRILRELVDVSRAAGGAVYLLEHDGSALRLEIARTRDGTTFNTIDEEYAVRVPLEIRNSIVSDVAMRRKVEERRMRSDDLKSVDRAVAHKLGVTSEHVSLIAVPLPSTRGETLGVVLLVTESDGKAAAKTRVKSDGEADLQDETPSGHLLSLIRAIAGSAAIALENKQLLIAQKNLLDSLIKLVASAIDAKSPHTGGHCTRVPALAKMLAEAAVKQRYGPFANFRLSEEEWEALELASWLHDCGKVTTPEYVVDKATKLETLYNRIHEIRTRFEVVKREYEIRLLRERLAGQNVADIDAKIEVFNAEIDADYAFVAEANIGGESMAPEKIERLKEISKRTWTRTLDDRLGLSHEETKRRAKRPLNMLPAIERVIDDKLEHIVVREERDQMPEDNQWGFQLKVPEHKFNLGELYNLSIMRGTLNDEERYIINDHIVQTIIMLESLPFPRHLRNVPEIAGGHHERMDGNGYPRKLQGSQMSVLARIMAIADVFEALTAGDRPYKKAKPLSEAIRIMGNFKKNGHLDPDLMDLFLESNVWMDYSYRFLNPEQMDEPDIRAVLALRPTSEQKQIGPSAGNVGEEVRAKIA